MNLHRTAWFNWLLIRVHPESETYGRYFFEKKNTFRVLPSAIIGGSATRQRCNGSRFLSDKWRTLWVRYKCYLRVSSLLNKYLYFVLYYSNDVGPNAEKETSQSISFTKLFGLIRYADFSSFLHQSPYQDIQAMHAFLLFQRSRSVRANLIIKNISKIWQKIPLP